MAIMKFKVKNHWTDNVQFTAKIECDEDSHRSVKLGLAVRWGLGNDANLHGAYLRGADLSSANLRGANLSSANLRSANLRGANLRGANLRGADLIDADLRSANLRSANLRGADLIDADLIDAYLRSAYLRSADLRSANLRGADLIDADLRGAYLRDADLRTANLRGADLSSADLRSANLRDADLSGAYLDKGKSIKLQGTNPILMLGPIGSESSTLFAYRTNQGIYLRRGCFFDSIKNFKIAVKARHGDNEHGVLYRAACDFITAWAGDQKADEAAA